MVEVRENTLNLRSVSPLYNIITYIKVLFFSSRPFLLLEIIFYKMFDKPRKSGDLET